MILLSTTDSTVNFLVSAEGSRVNFLLSTKESGVNLYYITLYTVDELAVF